VTGPSLPPEIEPVPIPYDQYPWDGSVDLAQPISKFQEALVKSAFPEGARVLDVRPCRRWDGRLTFPVFVRVQHAGRTRDEGAESNAEDTVLLRMERFRGGVEREASILPVLSAVGLPVPRLLAGALVQITRRAVVMSSIRDTQCGFKVFRRNLARAVFSRTRVRSFAFDIEALFIARKLGARIVEMPVTTTYRAESKFNVQKHLPIFLRDIVQIRLNDLAGRYHQ